MVVAVVIVVVEIVVAVMVVGLGSSELMLFGFVVLRA